MPAAASSRASSYNLSVAMPAVSSVFNEPHAASSAGTTMAIAARLAARRAPCPNRSCALRLRALDRIHIIATPSGRGRIQESAKYMSRAEGEPAGERAVDAIDDEAGERLSDPSISPGRP